MSPKQETISAFLWFRTAQKKLEGFLKSWWGRRPVSDQVPESARLKKRERRVIVRAGPVVVGNLQRSTGDSPGQKYERGEKAPLNRRTTALRTHRVST